MCFFSLLPVATLVTTNKPCLPPRPLMSYSGCAHENPNERGDNSLGFVHDTEGERKASSNFLKLSLRNEAVLVVVVVFEHRLWERRGTRAHVVTPVFSSAATAGVGGGGCLRGGRKGRTYIHHSLHMLADGARVRPRSNS